MPENACRNRSSGLSPSAACWTRTPLAELWPGLGAGGKQAVTVRHVLNHAAGVPGVAAVADAELWWEPGTRVGLARLEDAEGADEMMASMASMPKDLPSFNTGPIELSQSAELGSRTDILAVDITAGVKSSARAIARGTEEVLGDAPLEPPRWRPNELRPAPASCREGQSPRTGAQR